MGKFRQPRMRGRRLGGIVSGAIILMAALVACGADDVPTTEPVPVAIGLGAPVATLLVPFLAEQEGFFEREGLDATVQIILDVQVRQALAGGAVQFGVAASGQFDVVAGRAPVQLVGAWAERMPAVYVAAPGIESPADLRGKTVAVQVPGSITTVLTSHMLKEAGVDRDVNQEGGISPGVVVSAFAGGRVQGTVSFEPLTSALLAAVEGSSVIHDFSDVYWPVVIAVNTDWAESNREAVVAVLRALDAGVKEWWNNPDAAKAVIQAQTGIDIPGLIEAAYQETLTTFAEGVIPIRTEVQHSVLTILKENGAPDIDADDPESFLDMSFIGEM